MTRPALAATFLLSISPTAAGPIAAPRPPVIDMHVHSTSGSPEEQLARMTELNIRYIWLKGLAPDFPVWSKLCAIDGELNHRVCSANASPIRSAREDVFACAMFDVTATTMPRSRLVISDITMPPASSPLRLSGFVASAKRTRSDGVE